VLTNLSNPEVDKFGCTVSVTIRNRGEGEPQVKVSGFTEVKGWRYRPQEVFRWYCLLPIQRIVDRDDESSEKSFSVDGGANITQPDGREPSLASSSVIGSSDINSGETGGTSCFSDWLSSKRFF
jgi:hypothetical protein